MTAETRKFQRIALASIHRADKLRSELIALRLEVAALRKNVAELSIEWNMPRSKSKSVRDPVLGHILATQKEILERIRYSNGTPRYAERLPDQELA